MLVNTSDATFYLDSGGNVTEDEASGVSLLVAPGGRLDPADADRYGLADRLTPIHEVDQVDAAGEPVVFRGVRAVSESLVRDRPRNQVVPPLATYTRREPKQAAPKADAPQRGTVNEERATTVPDVKSVERAPENKAGFGAPPRAADRK